MFRKRLALLLASAMVFCSIPIASALAPIPGKACPKVGKVEISKNKKFTCLKSGSKKIWSKPKPIPSPRPTLTLTPTPTPEPSKLAANDDAKLNPFITPFPEEFNREQMVTAVIEKFEKYISSNSKTKSFKLVIGSEFERNSTAIAEYAENIYKVLPFPSEYPATIFVVSQDPFFTEKAISDFGVNCKADGNPGCINAAGFRWANSTEAIGPVTPHEIFHVWQRAAYKRNSNNNPDPSNPLNSPVWFDEGGADFFGYLMYNNRSSYYISPGLYRDYSSLKNYRTRALDPYLPYLLGRVACEYIVASVGFEKFLDIHFGVGMGLDFPTSFEKATGISLETFYARFDQNLKKMF